MSQYSTQIRVAIANLRDRFQRRDVTLWRWYTPGQPGFCDFPQPHFLNGRRYWWLSEIEEWEAAHTSTENARDEAS